MAFKKENLNFLQNDPNESAQEMKGRVATPQLTSLCKGDTIKDQLDETLMASTQGLKLHPNDARLQALKNECIEQLRDLPFRERAKFTWQEIFEKDENLVCQPLDRCVLVRGLPSGATERTLLQSIQPTLNFHEKVNHVVQLNNGVLVQFTDKQAAEAVINQDEHMFGDHPLKICLKPIPPLCKDRFIIVGKFESRMVLKTLLQGYDEKALFEVDEFNEPHSYLVTFLTKLDIEEMKLFVLNLHLDAPMKVVEVIQTDCILVKDLHESYINAPVKASFMNEVKVDGGKVTHVERTSSLKKAYVYFASYKDAATVAKKFKTTKIKIDDVEASVSLHYGKKRQKNRGLWDFFRTEEISKFFYIPSKDNDVFEFIKLSPRNQEELQKQLLGQANIKFITYDLASENEPQNVVWLDPVVRIKLNHEQRLNFEDECKRILNVFLDRFIVRLINLKEETVEIIREAFSWKKEDDVISCIISEAQTYHVYVRWNYPESGVTKVTGLHHDVENFMQLLQNTAINFSIVSSNYSEVEYKFLREFGFLQEMLKKFKDKMTSKEDNASDSLTYTDPVDDIKAAVADVKQMLKNVKKMQLPLENELQVLKTALKNNRIVLNRDLQPSLRKENIKALVHSNPELDALEIYYHDDDDLRRATDVIYAFTLPKKDQYSPGIEDIEQITDATWFFSKGNAVRKLKLFDETLMLCSQGLKLYPHDETLESFKSKCVDELRDIPFRERTKFSWQEIFEKDEDLFSERLDRSLLVRGLPSDATERTLLQYIQLILQSDDKVNRVIQLNDGVLVQFTDKHAAETALDRDNHMFGDNPLKICRKPIPSLYKDRFVVMGKFESRASLRTLLQSYDENALFEVEEFNEPNSYLVIFFTKLDIEQMKLFASTLHFQASPKVVEVVRTDCILVKDLHQSYKNAPIKASFLNEVKGDGGEVTHVERTSSLKKAYVYFASYKDAESVAKKFEKTKVEIDFAEASVSLHYGKKRQKNRGLWDCFRTEESKKSRKINQKQRMTFEDECTRILNLFLDRFIVRLINLKEETVEIIREAFSWKKENDMISYKVSEAQTYHVYVRWNYSRPGVTKIIGLSDHVANFMQLLQSTAINYSIVSSNYSEVEYQFLKGIGFLQEMLKKFKDKMTSKEDNALNSLTYSDPVDDIKAAVADVKKMLQNVKEKKLPLVNELKLLKTALMDSRIVLERDLQPTLRKEHIKAVVRASPGLDTLDIFYHEDDDLRRAADAISALTISENDLKSLGNVDLEQRTDNTPNEALEEQSKTSRPTTLVDKFVDFLKVWFEPGKENIQPSVVRYLATSSSTTADKETVHLHEKGLMVFQSPTSAVDTSVTYLPEDNSVNEQRIEKTTSPDNTENSKFLNNTHRKELMVLSYQQESETLVLQIKKRLELNGYQTRLVADRTDGDILDSATTDAIEHACAVVLCVSRKYKESMQCRAVAKRVYGYGKKVVITLLVEEYCHPNNWLDFVVDDERNKTILDFSRRDSSDMHSEILELMKTNVSIVCQCTDDSKVYLDGQHGSKLTSKLSEAKSHEVLATHEKIRSSQGTLLAESYEVTVLDGTSITNFSKDLYEEDSNSQLQGSVYIPSSSGSSSERNNKKHIFISYQQQHQGLIKEINESLKKSCYLTCVDYEKPFSDVVDFMVQGISNAAVVLLCFAESYEKSKNCRDEAVYAKNVHNSEDVIPLLIGKGYRPKGWTDFMIGAKFYHRVTDGYHKEQHEKLVKQIGDRGKIQ